MLRSGSTTRKTNETDIQLTLLLDGKGLANIQTGIGFLDHMLHLFTVHSRMDLSVICTGDLTVDTHHTVEDIGIALGMALKCALGDKSGISRYGTSYVPMDEALVRVTLDISNRPFLVQNIPFSVARIGELDTEMILEFFRAVTENGGITLHIDCIHGLNNHHMAEAAFKAFGRALKDAVTIDPTILGVLSSKGIL